MKSSAQVVVIGGGVVGASVLYHLTELGWTDVVLVERKELTAGSTWHAAGGMHTLNGDPNVAKLQQYTVGLYREIEQRVPAAGKGIRSAERVSARWPSKTIVSAEEHRRAEAFEWIAITRRCGSTTAARGCCC